MAEAYEVDYSDKRFTEVETDKSNALSESDKMYDQMIKDSDKYYNQQADAVKNYGDTQSKLTQEKTDFSIEQINQQKYQAKKDYLKDQSASYVDWQKQSNRYGAEAERQASVGVANSGYSESSQVAMYNQYQNRVMAARENYTRAVLNYDNAIKDAQLQNNSLLAEIAYNTLMKSLELSLSGLQYKNGLLLEKANRKLEIDQLYYQRRQDVLNQINHENSMAEQIRQFNESMAASGSSGSGGGGSYYSSGGGYSSGGSYYYDDDDGGSYGNVGGGSSSSSSSSGSKKSSGTAVSSKEKLALGKGPISDDAVKSMVASGQAHVDPISGKLEKGAAPTIYRNDIDYKIQRNSGK